MDGSTRYRVGRTYAFHILSAFYYDDEEKTYFFRLDPRWAELFSNREYALLDWDARLQIGREIAKTLQRLIATSTNPVKKFALDRLKAQMVYKSPMRKLHQALIAAVAELKRLGIIASGEIETSAKDKPQLVVHLPDNSRGVRLRDVEKRYTPNRPKYTAVTSVRSCPSSRLMVSRAS